MFKFVAVLLASFFLFSIETNATEIHGNSCTLGVLPVGNTMVLADKKDEILNAFESRGYFATELTSPKEMSSFEFVADGSVNCNSTYFGILAHTTVRLVQTETNKIIARETTQGIMDMFACKIELLKAIASLPVCIVK